MKLQLLTEVKQVDLIGKTSSQLKRIKYLSEYLTIYPNCKVNKIKETQIGILLYQKNRHTKKFQKIGIIKYVHIVSK